MKVLDKISLALFSCIILIMSVLLCLVIFGWVSLDVINVYIKYALADVVTSNITLVISVILIFLAIKEIFFTSDTKTESGLENGILIQTENGKLFISKETIQNLISGVAKEIEGAKDVSTKVILSKTNDINIDVVLFVSQDIIITDLSNKLQLKIKEVVKKSIDVDIREVNIKIKNITPKQEIEKA